MIDLHLRHVELVRLFVPDFDFEASTEEDEATIRRDEKEASERTFCKK